MKPTNFKTFYNVIDLLKETSGRQNVGYTLEEIYFRIEKSDRAIKNELRKLLKWNKIECIVLFFDSEEKTFLTLYRLIK